MANASHARAGPGDGEHGSEDDGLDLLLGLMEAEEVPDSPRPPPSREAGSEGKASEKQIATLGYCSDEERPKSSKPVSMAAFKTVVGTSLTEVKAVKQGEAAMIKVEAGGGDVEKHSGLRIKDRLVSCVELSAKFSDLRFLRLQSMKSAMMREKIKGAWATIGIVAEKANPKLSSAGKNFVVWKLSSLDGTVISLFLFGEAYNQHWKLPAGSMVAVFNAKTRQEQPRDLSLSVFSRAHVLKIGTSMDYSICKGTKKDGTACTVVLDRRQGEHCHFHAAEALRKLKTVRVELRGGKVINPFLQRNKTGPPMMANNPEEPPPEKKKQAKYLSSTALKKFLNNSEKVSTTGHLQGKRLLTFLSEVPDGKEQTASKKGRKLNAGHPRTPLGEKTVNVSAPAPTLAAKIPKVMELDLDSSDDVALHPMLFSGNHVGHQ